MNAYHQLINRLDQFIRKYYKNRLLKGVLLTLGILVFAYLFFVLIEYFGHFTTTVRTVFYYLFASVFALTIGIYIIFPLTKLFRFGKIISYKQAGEIIRSHFPDIKDRIQNALELYEQNQAKQSADILLLAAVNQKIADTELFPFKRAVNYKENLRYLRFVLPLIILLFGIWAFTPAVIHEGTTRLINHNKPYEKQAPFVFELITDTLTVRKGTDVELRVKTVGDIIPDEVFVEFSGTSFVMKKDKTKRTYFSYKLKNLNNSLKFNFSADTYTSDQYEINVLPAPLLLSFELNADVPEYTGETDFQLTNTGDISVPQGTKLTWKFNAKDADSMYFVTDKQLPLVMSENHFKHTYSALRDLAYTLKLKNSNFTEHIDVQYNISVRPDLNPAISLTDVQDTANFYLHYFKGKVADDYGLTKLNYKYRIVKKDTPFDNLQIPFTTNRIELPAGNASAQEFFHIFDFSELKLSDNQEIQYYFEIWDNDMVNGHKSAKSAINTFDIPSKSELNDLKNLASENVQSKMQQAQKLAQEIQSDFQKLQEKNLNGSMSEWESSQMLKSITDKQMQMQQLMQEAAKENEAKNQLEQQTEELDEELLEKQAMIEQLMEELMTDEMKQLMEELQKLQEQFNQEQLNQLLQDEKSTLDDLEERLDRNMELLKRFEVEQKMENVISEMEQLSEEMQKLSEQTEDKKSDMTENIEKQAELEDLFNELKQELEDAENKNSELEKPMEMPEMSDDLNEIQEEFNKSEQSMQENKRSKASESQSKNSKSMKDAASKMQAAMDGNSQEQEGEDAEAMRQLVDNLITFSFEQEDLNNQFLNINHKNPQFIELTNKQIGLKDEFTHISDSLKALAKRVPQISSKIQSESVTIEDAVQQTISFLEDRNLNTARNMQRKAMTSANNLALLLSEVLDQMQNSQSSGSGSGKSKPKKDKKGEKQEGFETMKQMQERMKQQMEQMMQQMKEGMLDKNAQNKKLAQMLAQQEIFKQMMQEMRTKQSLNPETQKLLNEINKLSEQIEQDLVNKRITPELMERQKMITTRLLEAEKAENQRETEKKRESNSAIDKKYTSPEDYFKKNKDSKHIRESLYRNRIMLNKFYDDLNNKYLQDIQ